MDATSTWMWQLDGWIIAAGVLCAVASSLVGNFLVLRRMSMLGDAVSHAVLPGLAAAFLITGSRQSMPMFFGAAIVGVLTAMLSQWIRNFGKVDEGASMGVVFTTLFALGLVMIVRAADSVDLDPGCVLYGAIEFTPLDTIRLGNLDVPRVVITLGVVTIINLLFVLLLYKELKLTSFDPALADTMGLRSAWVHYALMTLVAIMAVASFESVGNILVVAMMVVPAAAASMLTNRLPWLIVASAVIGALSAVLGQLTAITLPQSFGYGSTSTSGMMALAAGTLFMLVAIFSPHHGVLVAFLRHQRLSLSILGEDVLAYVFRQEEKGNQKEITSDWMRRRLIASSPAISIVLAWQRLTGNLTRAGDQYGLTDQGRITAASLVRSHRLWEQYLVDQAGVTSDRIHGMAERLEHFTDRPFRDELERQTAFPSSDPHGSPIPAEQSSPPPTNSGTRQP
ncbi:MAG: iron chelate uptake ABC transporter family permease subunit [Planctomycetaceae bacterium]